MHTAPPARLRSPLGALLPLAIGLVVAVITVQLVHVHPSGAQVDDSNAALAIEVAAGCLLVIVGVQARARVPAERAWVPLLGAGLFWFLGEWGNPAGRSAIVFTLGLLAAFGCAPFVAHLAMTYPHAKVRAGAGVAVVSVGYIGSILLLGLASTVLGDPRAQGCGLCPRDLLAVGAVPGVANVLIRWGVRVGIIWVVVVLLVIFGRLWTTSTPHRGRLAPVLVPAAVYLTFVALDFLHSSGRGWLSNDPYDQRLRLYQGLALLGVVGGIGIGRLQAAHTRTALARLVVDLSEAPQPGAVRSALAAMLDDPELVLAYPLPSQADWVDGEGRPASIEPSAGQSTTALVREGQPIAVIIHRSGLLDDPETVATVASTARLALDNESLHAQVQARFEQLRASRVRIVGAGDAERRRLERDLHDGAQQSLLALSMAIGSQRRRLASDDASSIALNNASEAVKRAIDELRELAHGIYPAVLTNDGLAAAVDDLRERADLTLDKCAVPERRFPPLVEGAAYLVIAEALGPVASAAGARNASVTADTMNGSLILEVVLSCVAEVPSRAASRLEAVADRVEVADGTLDVHLDGQHLTLVAKLPCES